MDCLACEKSSAEGWGVSTTFTFWAQEYLGIINFPKHYTLFIPTGCPQKFVEMTWHQKLRLQYCLCSVLKLVSGKIWVPFEPCSTFLWSDFSMILLEFKRTTSTYLITKRNQVLNSSTPSSFSFTSLIGLSLILNILILTLINSIIIHSQLSLPPSFSSFRILHPKNEKIFEKYFKLFSKNKYFEEIDTSSIIIRGFRGGRDDIWTFSNLYKAWKTLLGNIFKIFPLDFQISKQM